MPRFATKLRTLLQIGLAAALALASPLAAHAQAPADRWAFTVTPYVYLPNVDGTLRYGVPPNTGGSPEVGVGPNNYLEHLSLALMLAGEARKGSWSIISDLVYLDFNNQKGDVKSINFGGSAVSSTANVNTESSLKGLEWTLASARTVAQSDRANVDLLTGFRYFSVEARSDWQLSATVSGPGAGQTFPASGNISRRTEMWDWIIGVRGRVRLGEGPWFAPYYLDIGWGSSSPTWQAVVGIGYSFDSVDALLTYRYLAYDQGDNRLFQDFRFAGPALGVSFRF
jgi:hypothetical protein